MKQKENLLSGRKRRSGFKVFAFLSACVLALCLSSVAWALVGPVNTPPGGVTITLSDPSGQSIGFGGGLDVTYSGFDLSQSETLYWGAALTDAVQFCFDGSVDAPGETMTFQPALSDLPNGMARWRGSAQILYWDVGGQTWLNPVFDTQFTLRVTDLSNVPIPMTLASNLGVPGSGAVITVTGDFKANLLMETNYGGWNPALAVFNSLETDPGWEDGVLSSFTDEFYYTDVPIAGLSATNDSPTMLGNATTLTATLSAGTNVNYNWAFGDGTSGSGVVTAHPYPAAGVYTAVVTATNDANWLTATTTVVVEEGIAGLSATNDSPTKLGDLTTLTATLSAGTNVNYAWALGDGTYDSGAVVVNIYPAMGNYTAVVTASNSVSVMTATTWVAVYNLPPIAADDVYTTSEDISLTVSAPGVLGNDSDPDVDPLTAMLDDGPSVGFLDLSADGSFVYTPTLNWSGLVTFSYIASDSTLTDTARVTINVTPVNDAPVAVDDAYGTAEDTALVVAAPGVLGNDDDAEGDSLDALLDSGPAEGQLAWGGDGSFVYTPTLDWNGLITFTYHADDGNSPSNIAVVSVTVSPVCDSVEIITVSTSISGCLATFTPELNGDGPFDYLWSFGDGVTSTEAITSHLYTMGSYSVTLEVWNCTSTGYDTITFPLTVICEPPYWKIYLPIVFKQYSP